MNKKSFFFPPLFFLAFLTLLCSCRTVPAEPPASDAVSTGEASAGFETTDSALPREETEGDSSAFYEFQLTYTARSKESVAALLGGDPALHEANGAWEESEGTITYSLHPFYYGYLSALTSSKSALDLQPGILGSFFPNTAPPSADTASCFHACDELAKAFAYDYTDAHYYVLDPVVMDQMNFGTAPSPTALYEREQQGEGDSFFGLPDEAREWCAEDSACLAVYENTSLFELPYPVVPRSKTMNLFIIWHPLYGVVHLSCPPVYTISLQKDAEICTEEQAKHVIPAALSRFGIPYDCAQLLGYRLGYTYVKAFDKDENIQILLRPCWICDFKPSVNTALFYQYLGDEPKEFPSGISLWICLDAITCDPAYYWEASPLP